jgi:hypothetical protein
MDNPIGRRRWAIAEGYIPSWSNGPEPQFTSHETACILNTSDQEAHVQIMVYFSDKEPLGPYRITVPARRTLHQRFNELDEPEPIPKDTDYASVIESDVPIVVQHTRLDSRQAENALLSTVAYASKD